MKCVKKGNEIVRVKDDKAKNMVEEKGWQYCPKSEYKKYKNEK